MQRKSYEIGVVHEAAVGAVDAMLKKKISRDDPKIKEAEETIFQAMRDRFSVLHQLDEARAEKRSHDSNNQSFKNRCLAIRADFALRARGA